MARRIVDANICVSLVLTVPYSAKAQTLLQGWLRSGDELMVPTLWEYEIVSAIRRAAFRKAMPLDETAQALQVVFDLEPTIVTPTMALHRRTMNWAARLNQASACDAHYLAVAEAMNAEFWTADVRLYSRAQQLGLDWVHVVEA